MHLAECKHPIGIDSRVQNLLTRLSIGSNDVQFIGICGFSGIGKTTIAEAVYNRILSTFSRHSFISDVGKQAMQCMGLASLQKRLLKDIFKTEVDIGHYRQGKKLIEHRLCKEKVLIVLDNVDIIEQVDALAGELNWFGQGSRVIITTTSEHILNVAKVDKDKIYWPQELDEEESLQLSSLHAFSLDEPPKDYIQLSHDIVRYSGGLPSILEVLGSHLSDISSKEEWKSTLRKLKAGKVSISTLASLRIQKNNTSMKDNNSGWRSLLHGTNGNKTPIARVSKSTGGYRNVSTATLRVGKRFRTKAKIKAALSKITGRYLNQNGSIATDRLGKKFKIAEIRAATKNFDESLVIGVGGFGRVYKGVLNDGTLAAFKHTILQPKQGLIEFDREIEMLSMLRHRNVVSMIGFCKDEMTLVYEYMANGDLTKHLFGNDLPPLTWKQRLEICIGIARGLHYLHTGSERGIIHRDIKTANILLDEKFVAKISDFGLSKPGPALGHTHVSTVAKGTPGYIDPEYFRRQQLTGKSDVYSFGVVLFEVVCARPAMDKKLLIEQVNLVEWALQWQRQQGSLETIVDPRLEGNYYPESLKNFGEIAEKCVADEGKNRPTMWEVLQDLAYFLQLHETWLRDKVGDEYFTCSSLVGTVEFGDSRIGIGSALVGNDDSTGEEYFTCSSLVGTVGCDEFFDLVNLQGGLE
ncbi:receptor-like protein kinase HERK 1 [Telopea speciosissima]|uniref:receptor-like protein kinase HERK 1 n=1 Tax=Telopea speciosissima TaxID=54955 RepID=UPI001CC8016D|nr:receptor-like protein kinase HERK 1 [Telopea speciosissima]